MSESPAESAEQQQSSESQTSDPRGGISASGRTADQFSPESQVPGDDYGNTGAETTTEADGQDVSDSSDSAG
jgi:hypothetical protein